MSFRCRYNTYTFNSEKADSCDEQVQQTRSKVQVEVIPNEVAERRILASRLRVKEQCHVLVAPLLSTECADDVSAVDACTEVAEEGSV